VNTQSTRAAPRSRSIVGGLGLAAIGVGIGAPLGPIEQPGELAEGCHHVCTQRSRRPWPPFRDPRYDHRGKGSLFDLLVGWMGSFLPDPARSGLPGETLLLIDIINAEGLVIIQTVWATTPDRRRGHRLTPL
jgi:hypothetical protein